MLSLAFCICAVEWSAVAYAPAVCALNGRKVAHAPRILNGGFTIHNVGSYIGDINTVFMNRVNCMVIIWT